MIHIRIIYIGRDMGIVNIDDALHDQLRKASSVSCRSINAQAAFWIKIGMLCELHPTLNFNEVVAGELRAAGVEAPAVMDAPA